MQRYPVREQAVADFWRALSSEIERADHEVHEAILEKTMSLVTQGFGRSSIFSNDEPKIAHRIIEINQSAEAVEFGRGLLDPCASDESTRTFVMRMNGEIANNVGLTGWPAGYFLAELVLARPELVAGKRVLELGSGIGFTAAAVQHSKPQMLMATDYHLEVLLNLKRNLLLNGLDVRPEEDPEKVLDLDEEDEAALRVNLAPNAQAARVFCLDWELMSEETLAGIEADVILCGDCIYMPDVNPMLVTTIKRCLSSVQGSVCYSAQCMRNPESFAGFLRSLDEAGLQVEELTADLVQSSAIPHKLSYLYSRAGLRCHAIRRPQ